MKSLDEIQYEAVMLAIKESGGNKSKAARELKISRMKLYRILNSLPKNQ